MAADRRQLFHDAANTHQLKIMASFVFGSTAATTPTPAAPGAFSFGGPSPAPAAGGGFGFGGNAGSTAPAPQAPTPAAGGFSFGGTSATNNPAGTSAAPSGFSFGAPSTNAPATGGGFSFGAPGTTGAATPTTSAPSSGLFGANPTTQPTAAPATGFGFSLAAPATGGAPAAPAPFSFAGAGGGATSTGLGFGQPGTPTNPAVPGGAPPPNLVTGKTPYSSLPPEYQKAIDAIHEAMMKHKRSLMHVQAMGPQGLMLSSNEQALPSKLKKLQQSLNVLQQNVESLMAVAAAQREEDRKVMEQTYMYAKWPTEAMAARRGVRFTQAEEKKEHDPDLRTEIREMLEQQLAYVDRIERMPSPYLWQTLDKLSQRLQSLSKYIVTVGAQLESSKSLENSDVVNLESIVDNQDQFIYAVRTRIHRIHRAMDKLRTTYNKFETIDNVLEKAQLEEWNHRKEIEEQIQMQLLRSAGSESTTLGATTTTTTTTAPNLAIAPAAPLAPPAFGASAAPTPATPAPAFSFAAGPTPPAPSFGAAPAVGLSTTPSFGAAKTPAPTVTTTPKKKSSSRSSSRSRR